VPPSEGLLRRLIGILHRGGGVAFRSRTLIPILFVLAWGLAGCGGRPPEGMLVPVTEDVEGTSRVAILAATTRQKSTKDPGEMFTGDRAEEVSYAAVTVSIPPDNARKIGEVQWAGSPPGDPRRDFVTVSASYLDKPAFVRALSTAAAKPTAHEKVLVFVHGFNNRFDDAVYRFAQIAHDSKSPAVPVLFTWPSRGELRLRAYTYDRESANYSRDALEDLLDLLSRNPNVAEINVVAHSMGNWLTLEALRTRAIRTSRGTDKVKNVLLVAPDVDVDVFRTELRRMGPVRPRLAVFVSQDDQALNISESLWGGVPRLGAVNPAEEPYHSEFAQANIEVFDLTSLKSAGDDAHDRAFTDVTSVMDLIKQRFRDGQQLTEREARASD